MRRKVARNWYRNEKYPLIPEKPGIRRGIPREGDSTIEQFLNSPIQFIIFELKQFAINLLASLLLNLG